MFIAKNLHLKTAFIVCTIIVPIHANDYVQKTANNKCAFAQKFASTTKLGGGNAGFDSQFGEFAPNTGDPALDEDVRNYQAILFNPVQFIKNQAEKPSQADLDQAK